MLGTPWFFLALALGLLLSAPGTHCLGDPVILSTISIFPWLSSQGIVTSTLYFRSLCLIVILVSQLGCCMAKIKSACPPWTWHTGGTALYQVTQGRKLEVCLCRQIQWIKAPVLITLTYFSAVSFHSICIAMVPV